MRTKWAFVIFLASISAAATAEFAGVGNWKGDLDKLDPRGEFTQFDMKIELVGPATYRATLNVDDKSRGKGQQQFTITCDGKEHPFQVMGTAIESGQNETAVCQQTRSKVQIRQMRKGKILITNTFNISPDGQVMNYTLSRAEPQGQTFKAVLTRVAS